MNFPYGGHTHASPQPGAPALHVHNLSVTYPGAERAALENVSITVQPGEKVALIGPNGAGKSTLIKAVAGLTQQDSGTIRIFGNPIQACHHRTAYVPQRGEVRWRFPVTVEQVVMMGRYAHMGWFKRPNARDRAAVQHALDAMSLSDLADRQVANLSGGQQQRVMLARALAQQSDLLLLDEPLNNVDVKTQAMIFDLLDQLSLEGKAIIVSIHDLGTLESEFRRAIFLDRTVVSDGPVQQVLNPDLLARAYGFQPHVCPPETLELETVTFP